MQVYIATDSVAQASKASPVGLPAGLAAVVSAAGAVSFSLRAMQMLGKATTTTV